MRKKLLLLISTFVFCLPMSAVDNMCVKLKDGAVVSYGVENVEEVYFCEKNPDESCDSGATGVAQGHTWVDLGLSSGTLWSTCNVGAESSLEWGNFYAWADTDTKMGYTSANCSTFGLSVDKLVEGGFSDKGGVLASAFDVAQQNWGDGWKMPSKENFQELVNECSWRWASVDGVLGYEVKSKKVGNKNSIFLPAVGCMDGDDLIDLGNTGYYWTSTAYSSNVYLSWGLTFSEDGGLKIAPKNRREGFSVRPIYVAPEKVEPVIVDASETPLKFNALSDSTVEVIYDKSYISLGLDSIVFPEKVRIDGVVYTVTSIGEWAFANCHELKSVVIPSSVKTIRDLAFADAYLEKLVIPEGVVSIEGGAFYQCYKLQYIEIPSSVTNIGDQAFVNDGAEVIIKNIYGKIKTGYEAFLGSKVVKFLDDINDTTIVEASEFPLKFWIRFDSTGVDVYDVDTTEIQSIVIPAKVRIDGTVYNVTTISALFRNVKGLKKVVVPSSVQDIYDYSFAYCEDLDVVVDNFEYLVWQGACVFCGCKSVTFTRHSVKDSQELVDTTIVDASETPLKFNALSDSTVEVIYDKSYHSLSSVVIPEKVRIDGVVYTVTSIGEWAFEYCQELKSVVIPSSVKTIRALAFTDTYLEKLVIPEGVVSIENGAFYGCFELQYIEIPSSVTNIGRQAFYNDGAEVVIKNIYDNINFGDEAFMGSKYVRFSNDTIDTTVVDISETPLKFTTFPEEGTAMVIYDESYKEMTTVVIPANIRIGDSIYVVDGIGSRAFAGCEKLKSVEVPTTVSGIGSGAFNGCTGMSSLHLSWMFNSPGEYTFREAENLDVVIDNYEYLIHQDACAFCYAKVTFTRK